MLIMRDQLSKTLTLQWDIHLNKRNQILSEVAGDLQTSMILRNGSWWKPRTPAWFTSQRTALLQKLSHYHYLKLIDPQRRNEINGYNSTY